MVRIVKFILVLILIFSACDRKGIDTVDDCSEVKIQKIIQTFSFDPVHLQYGVYHYDKNCNITKYEFYLGGSGKQRLSYYANYYYTTNKLDLIETFVILDQKTIKTLIEKYQYDHQNRLKSIDYSALSEIDNSWYDGKTEFYFNDHDQLIKTTASDGSYNLYFYDSNGNICKYEHYPINAEYSTPLTITYTHDTKKNPLYLHDRRYEMVKFASPNNILGWESYAPETGKVVSKSNFEYEYNARGFPVAATETVITPLTDAAPNTMIFYTRYEYTQ